jgi:hypothetical protein
MDQQSTNHDHAKIVRLVQWLRDDTNLDWSPFPQYNQIRNKPLDRALEYLLGGIISSIDAHFFHGELAKHCVVSREFDLRDDTGRVVMGMSQRVNNVDGSFKVSTERDKDNRTSPPVAWTQVSLALRREMRDMAHSGISTCVRNTPHVR